MPKVKAFKNVPQIYESQQRSSDIYELCLIISDIFYCLLSLYTTLIFHQQVSNEDIYNLWLKVSSSKFNKSSMMIKDNEYFKHFIQKDFEVNYILLFRLQMIDNLEFESTYFSEQIKLNLCQLVCKNRCLLKYLYYNQPFTMMPKQDNEEFQQIFQQQNINEGKNTKGDKLKKINKYGLSEQESRNKKNANSFMFNDKISLAFLIALILVVFLIYSYPSNSIDDDEDDGLIYTSHIDVSKQLDSKIVFAKRHNQTKSESCQKKYKSLGSPESVIKQIETGISQQRYLKDSRYVDEKDKTGNISSNSTAIKQQAIGDLAKLANSKLINPEYPQSLRNVYNYRPFKQLPFCLFVKLSKNNSKQFNSQLVKSVLNLNYTNYITNFFGDIQTLNDDSIASLLQANTNRMFFKLPISDPTYHEYRYIMHQVCVRKSIVFFVGFVLKNDSLQVLQNFYQSLPVFLTYSQNTTMYFVHSFPMRLFDLLYYNDFDSSNEEYFTKKNKQKLFTLGLIQLSRRITKKFSIGLLYQDSYFNSSQAWLTAISKTDKQSFKRSPYQGLFSLSQNTLINEKQMEQNLLSVRKGNNKPDNITQIEPSSILESLEDQSMLYLPEEHALYKKIFYLRQNNYGFFSHINKPNAQEFEKRPFCVVMLGKQKENRTAYHNQRTLESFISVLEQNYTNYHIVYFDDGLDPKTSERIAHKAKQYGLDDKRFKLIRNHKKMSSTFNIIRSAFQFCKPNELLVPVQSDVVIIDPHFLNLMNNINGYSPDIWLIYTAYKTTSHKFGYSYRLRHDSHYRNFSERVKGLNYLSPLPVFEVSLLKHIPLQYHLGQNREWLSKCWLKHLEHSLAQLCSVSRVQYISQIQFSTTDQHQAQIDECTNSDIGHHIESLPYLKLMQRITDTNLAIQSQVKFSIASKL